MNPYMLLSRLQMDCEYFINTSKSFKHLWAGNPAAQIKKMKEVYNNLIEKPEWLSYDEILNYEKAMIPE